MLKQSVINDKKVSENGLKLKKRKNSIDKKLDAAWSKLVKLIAGNRCEVCGITTNLNSHHIYSRAKKSLRWNTINGICLCVGHHIGHGFSAHKTPLNFNNWLIDKKGNGFINELMLLANTTKKFDEFEKNILLIELNKQIDEIENNKKF